MYNFFILSARDSARFPFILDTYKAVVSTLI